MMLKAFLVLQFSSLVYGTNFIDLSTTYLDKKLDRCVKDKEQLRNAQSQKNPDLNKIFNKVISHGVSQKQWQTVSENFKKLGSVIKNKSFITIVDYSLPSNKKRMFIVNLKNGKVFKTFVAHGKGNDKNHDRCVDRDSSGKPLFTNLEKSKAASKGFMITGGFYKGKHGKSLMLHGLQKGINDKACMRSIVIHGAHYIPWGRSWGCPSVSPEDRDKVFEMIAHGSLFYIDGEKACVPPK